jgi:hypothetical protein
LTKGTLVVEVARDFAGKSLGVAESKIVDLDDSKVNTLAAAVLARAISGEREKSCPADCAEKSRAGSTVKNCCWL